MQTTNAASLLAKLEQYNEHELRRLLIEQLTRQKVGLYWESDSIARDTALNADVVLPRRIPESCFPVGCAAPSGNLIMVLVRFRLPIC